MSSGPGAAPATAEESLRGPVVRAAAWTVGGYGLSQFIRFAGNLLLARLLFPEVFGLSALVVLFVQGLSMFSDVGTGPAIVQSPRGDDPEFLQTAWTVQCVRGAFLWACCCLIAAPVASFYDQPLIAQLLPIAGLTALLAGFESTSMHTLQRHLRLERLTILDLVSQVLGLVSIIVLALLHRSTHGAHDLGAVWATIGGSLVSSTTRLVLSHTRLPGIRHRFRLERQALAALLRFGRWVFVSTLFTFLAGQSDRLVFGKMIPLALLGIYGIAQTLAMFPTQAAQRLGSSVLFPAYSRLAGTDDFRHVFGRMRLPVLVSSGAVASGAIACGPFLIRSLYDSRYQAAGWILQYLSVAAWFQSIESTNSAVLVAQGRVSLLAANNAIKFAGLALLVPLGFHVGGFRGALVALVLSDVLKYTASALGVAASGLRGFGWDALLSLVIAGSSCAALLAGSAVLSRSHANWLALSVAACLAGVAWAVVGLCCVMRVGVRRAARLGFTRRSLGGELSS